MATPSELARRQRERLEREAQPSPPAVPGTPTTPYPLKGQAPNYPLRK
jgi:hypothetical protein